MRALPLTSALLMCSLLCACGDSTILLAPTDGMWTRWADELVVDRASLEGNVTPAMDIAGTARGYAWTQGSESQIELTVNHDERYGMMILDVRGELATLLDGKEREFTGWNSGEDDGVGVFVRGCEGPMFEPVDVDSDARTVFIQALDAAPGMHRVQVTAEFEAGLTLDADFLLEAPPVY